MPHTSPGCVCGGGGGGGRGGYIDRCIIKLHLEVLVLVLYLIFFFGGGGDFLSLICKILRIGRNQLGILVFIIIKGSRHRIVYVSFPVCLVRIMQILILHLCCSCGEAAHR